MARHPKAKTLHLRLFVDRAKNPMADVTKVSFNRPIVNL
jgi:hypothetical protein